MPRQRARAFTLVEILVAVAILAILLGMIFKPLLMGIEVLSIGRAEREAQATAQQVVDRMAGELRTAVKVYSNLGTFDLPTGATAGNNSKWHTAQPERVSFVPAAVDNRGKVLSPVQPATDSTGRPMVVTYWVMRGDVTQPYDPMKNPRRVFRAVSYYQPFSENQGGQTLSVTSPDDLYGYAVRRLRLTGGGSLQSFGPTVWPLLFDQGRAFDWLVANTDRSYAAAPATAAERIMRSPEAQPTGTPDTYTHASAMLGISPITEAGTDVREAQFLPYRLDQEQLTPNRSFGAYHGTLRRWQEPYQRTSDALWTAPATGVVATSTGAKPLIGMFRVQDVRDGAGPLELNYFLSLDQDPASLTVGHVILYRMPTAVGGVAIPVYDVTDYPKRVFGTAPGTAPAGSPAVGSGEMACGIDWSTGEVLTTFPQEDFICPSGDGSNAAVVALNNHDHQGTVPAPPLFAAGSPAPAAVWQSLPLCQGGNAGSNGFVIDDHYVVNDNGTNRSVWTGYTLSAFRPERLQTGALGLPNLSLAQINMSLVLGSLHVVVEKRPAANLTGQPLASRSYQVVESVAPGAPPALRPFQCYCDPGSGKLVFYDPQLSGDAVAARDGYNPPQDTDNEAIGGVPVRTVIHVTYEYRNNLPTVLQMLAGNDSNRDVVEMTYRSQESLVLNLTLDVPADSTHGLTEAVGDPADASVPTSERPTGARRRVTVQQRLTVGAK